MTKVLMKGNEALGEAAIRAGCVHFFGYPITPQTEIIETLARWIDNSEMDGRLVTLESEHSMITAAGAAAATGVRASSPARVPAGGWSVPITPGPMTWTAAWPAPRAWRS